MWTVIYIAPTMEIAHRIRDRMADEGFEIRLRPIIMGKSQQFEISVRETEVLEIQDLLVTILHEQ